MVERLAAIAFLSLVIGIVALGVAVVLGLTWLLVVAVAIAGIPAAVLGAVLIGGMFLDMARYAITGRCEEAEQWLS